VTDPHPVLISTIVLNWNRAILLRQTLRSYADTVSGPAEIVVVDNGSMDESLRVIEEARSYLPRLKTVFLDQNIGGEAVNQCFDKVSGELIHISENDLVYLPDWADHVRKAFLFFPDLGQLSLFGATSLDHHPRRRTRPSRLRFAQDKILYEALGNVGTASVLRASLINRHEIRIHNKVPPEPGGFKFPDDGRLSADVKEAGFWCAWSDRYYVRNLGHELAEFDRDPDYYEQNYASKPWIGVAEWRRLVAEARHWPQVRRHSVVFPDASEIQPERTMIPVGDKPPQLWSMFDGFTAEIEVLDFLYTLVRLTKPQRVLETGTWLGRSAIAIASALRDNGIGHLVTIESNGEAAEVAVRNIDDARLTTFVTLRVADSLAVELSETYELALFDSDISIRATEFCRFYDRLKPGAIVLFHDTAGSHIGSADRVVDLMTTGMLEGIFLPTPRGIFVGRVVKPSRPQSDGTLGPLR
jgi:glycosyltransferase involved in cell wall biosynthesis/protein-L-isoaspartate O-methyltransferase